MNSRMPESKSGALTAWRHPKVLVGRATRIELTTSRATIWRSNQLSYARHIILVRLKRFELLTHGLEGRCSIQLSYRRILIRLKASGAGDGNRTHAASLEGWNSTIELHPHVFCCSSVPTTLVYNNTIFRNCQTKLSHFLQNYQKNFLLSFSCDFHESTTAI